MVHVTPDRRMMRAIRALLALRARPSPGRGERCPDRYRGPAAVFRGSAERSETGTSQVQLRLAGQSLSAPALENWTMPLVPPPEQRGAAASSPAARPPNCPSWRIVPNAVRKHYAWADMLQRTVAADGLACPDCGGWLRLLTTTLRRPSRGLPAHGRRLTRRLSAPHTRSVWGFPPRVVLTGG